jgi:hypothetical protein
MDESVQDASGIAKDTADEQDRETIPCPPPIEDEITSDGESEDDGPRRPDCEPWLTAGAR